MPLTKLQAEGLNLADTFAFSGTVSGAGGGKVLAIYQDTKTDKFTSNSSSLVDITGFEITGISFVMLIIRIISRNVF